MNQTKQTPRKKNLGVFVCILLAAAPALADEYRDARAELVEAYQQSDYAAMLAAAKKALAARPEYPGGIFNLALGQSLSGDPEGSLQTLEILLRKGIDFGVDQMDEFAVVRKLDRWDAYALRAEALHAPFGDASIAVTVDSPQFVPEGIAIDAAGDIFLGSIRTGELIRATGDVERLSDGKQHWSVFGMRFHTDGSLWFASAAVPQRIGSIEDIGKTGLFRMDVATGAITRSAILPQLTSDSQVLGDLIIADEKTIYTTDSLTGTVYRYDIEKNEYSTLLEAGTLGSPQGLVLDKSGSYLFVADYIGGVYRVSLADSGLVKLKVDAAITDFGIDGLYRYGSKLIAIQNGITPNRVAALVLSDDGLSITSAELLAANLDFFDEPTLGAIRGNQLFFVANSHWNRFDRDNRLPDGLTGPIVLQLDIP